MTNKRKPLSGGARRVQKGVASSDTCSGNWAHHRGSDMRAIARALDLILYLSQHRIADVSAVEPGMQLTQIANSPDVLPPPLHSRKI